MEINNLSKTELVKLKQDIDDRLKSIEDEKTTPMKKTILSLKQDDKIFGIRLSFGGHRLKEPDDLIGKVDILDYCNIKVLSLGKNSPKFSMSISHPTRQFGISTTLRKEDYIDEHCYLNIDLMKTGYDGFYTLKPETWKEDLIRMLNKDIEDRKKYFQQDLCILDSKLKLFIQSEKKINEKIKLL
jgi:hypothetical protein